MNSYNLVINGGRVIDIESKTDDVINVGIEREIIRSLSKEKLKGKKEINASGLIITPGFIDIHAHEDSLKFSGLDDQNCPLPIETSRVLLRTGVTTIIGGNCGFSAYPIKPYLDKITKNKLPINYGTLIGYNVLREIIGIDKYRNATKKQIEKLKNMVEKEISTRALGVSFGLQYSPGIATTEVIEISKIVKKFGKYIAIHMRYDYSQRALEAVEEMVKVARETRVSVEISHLVANVYGKDDGKNVLEEALLLIHEAVDEGLDISADVYPYNTWGTSIKSTVFDEGWIDNYNFSYKDLEILTGTHAGERCTPELFDSLRAEDKDTSIACHNAIPLNDVRRAIQDSLVCIVSDGQMTKEPLTGDLKGHPRSAGTPAKLIGDIIREKKWISLKEGISKLTLIPAKRLKLSNKGRLQEGKDADITVFNLEKIIDKSKFGINICASPPEGIEYVILNGDIAYEKKIIKRNDLGQCI
jgi:N-acyl-D-amino-acid deacylase